MRRDPRGPTGRPCRGRALCLQATHTDRQGSASVGHCPLLAAHASACCRPIPDRALAGHDCVSGRGLARPALGVRVSHTWAEADLPHPLQRGCVLGATAAQPHSSVRVPREPWDTGVTSSPPHRSPWPAAAGAAANKSPHPMRSCPARGASEGQQVHRTTPSTRARVCGPRRAGWASGRATRGL